MATRLEILKEIQDGGHNIVTCGMCGHILLVRTNEEEHKCVVCNTLSEPCDFPDFISSTDDTNSYPDDMYDDAEALASAGHGTDEDYGYYGEDTYL